MNLPEYAVKRPVTTVMVFAGLVFLGAVTLIDYPQELFPKISFPQVTVVTDYVNAAPEEIETLITRPLEEAISSVSGLRRIESISREGKSTITVSFNWNQNIDFAALAVREKIDLVKERLPKESEDPVVLKFDPLSRPILILSVTGKLPPAELKHIAERTLKDNLEKVEGVASINVSGGLDREILVDLDQGRMQAAGVSILEVIDAVDASNISYPAGSIKKGLYEYVIRTVGEFRSIEEIGYTVVKIDTRQESDRPDTGFLERGARGPRETVDTKRELSEKGITDKRIVLLHDIAEVKDTVREKTSISRYNGHENVSLSIQKQASINAIDLVGRIKSTLAFLYEDLASRGVNVEVIYDHSSFIKKAVSSTKDAAIQGGFLAALVLFLFLREWRSATLVAITIPISLIASFFLMKLQGITINTMSLAGLALGSGMIIDNSIVVIENIYRLTQLGYSREEASVKGTNEVFWPVVSSALTSEAVFIPLILFVPGVAGQLFKDLSWAVVHSLNISFLVSVWLVPLGALYIRPKKPKDSMRLAMNRMQHFFESKSRRAQNTIFLSIVGVGVFFFVLGLGIFKLLDTEVIPKIDQGQFLVKVNLPVGSRIEATDALAQKIEARLAELPEVETIAVTIGSTPTRKAGEVRIDSLRASQGIILVTLKKDRRKSSHDVLQSLQEGLSGTDMKGAEVEYVLQENEFEFAATGGKPIVVEVKGYDLELIKSLTEEVKRNIQSIPGVSEILDDMGAASPETKIEIDKRKASLYAISARDISLTAKAAIDGALATEYKEAGREIDVRVKLNEADRSNIDQLRDLLIYSDTLEVTAPIKAVAALKQGYGPSEIKRKDQIRTATVTASIQKGYKEKDALKQVAQVVNGIEHPNSYDIKLMGKAREVKESFNRIAFAIILALILNYMIMAAQFESFIQPFIIMLTVPLSIFGVAVALLVTGTAVSVISLLGILILAGTVVNNGIVLIDFINQSRAEGMELVKAAIESAFVRFRPIMMTAVTTIAGLIPLALGIGEGAELQAPLSVSIMGGVIVGTIFTLCVLPAVYVLFLRASDRMIGIREE